MKTIHLKECLKLNLKFLFLSSHLPINVSSKSYINKLYRGFNIVIIFLIVFVGSGVPLYLIFVEYSLEDGIELMSMLVTLARCIIRFGTFIFYRKRISNLITKLYNNFNVHGESFNEEESQIIAGTIAKCNKITKYYVGLFICTGISMAMQPITATDEQFVEDSNTTSDSQRSLPFKTYFPKWNAALSPQYEMEYTAQSYTAIMGCFGIGAIDSFCVTLLMCVSCQFELLCISLRNVKKNILLKINKEKETNSFSELNKCEDDDNTPVLIINNIKDKTEITLPCECENSTMMEMEITIYITKCIRHHQAMLGYVLFKNLTI